ncbi:SDR family NAD(P)-dependent oxidoreductase [Nocardioides sp.]|uniref:SDR family NAD(P)-dependent oxidoreductase n=1 Tax=Nocardioides sp. TaxID=35761 RepID=UPI0035B19134
MTSGERPLEGKTIWVTGAGRGLGRAIASGLVNDGATVVATARSAETLHSLAAEHGDHKVIVAPGSVADEAEVDEILATSGILSAGRLDGLVNCAGISPSFARSEALEVETFRQILETNTIGTFICAQAAGRVMLSQPEPGSIVNVSSVHARVGFPRIAAYAASKGAVDALTTTLAVEWADRGVRVNTLAPGYYDTDLSHGLLESAWGDDIVRRTPMGRTGEPHELAGAVTFLLSDASSYVTGTTLSVDGGWQAW